MPSFNDAFKSLTDSLHRLRSAKARHHNTLLSISRLPNELLVKIFAFASVPKRGLFMNSLRRYRLRNRPMERMLAALAFVCHKWREIVHHTPSLWAYICSDRPQELILECLARSGQAPLHISLNPIDLHGEEFRTKIFREIHRWKSVEISGTVMKGFEELKQRPAPLLEKCCIRYAQDIGRALSLFCGSANRLRHLSLFDLRIPWESDLLSRLRTLEISNDDYGPSTQQVVSVLRSCSDLTTFKLHLPSELRPGPMPLDASIIDLSQLEHLSIKVHPPMTEDLLRRMRIPACKMFDVNQVEATGLSFDAVARVEVTSS
ncbi:hypothetical protein FRB95_013165 [Tulasnella sp. JGI-2019a]|nr:hypothetical protein FRB95_013165 [Tulasnella sp. JGI-2019a]